MATMQQCDGCGARLAPFNRSGYCHPCRRRQCLICSCVLYEDEAGSCCQDCRDVLNRLARLHKPPGDCRRPVPNRSARVARLAERAALGQPLFGEAA